MRQEIKSNRTHRNHAVTNMNPVCVWTVPNQKYVFVYRKEALQQTLAGTQTLKLWVRPHQGMRWRHVTTPSFVPLSLPTSCSPSLSPPLSHPSGSSLSESPGSRETGVRAQTGFRLPGLSMEPCSRERCSKKPYWYGIESTRNGVGIVFAELNLFILKVPNRPNCWTMQENSKIYLYSNPTA